MSDAGQRILIVLMGSLGDVVRGLSVAQEIKRQRPETKLTWLVEPKCREIVSLAQCVDRVLVFDRANPIAGFFRLRESLREESFDVTLDMQRHFKSGLFSWLSNAPRRIGFHRANAKEGNWLFQTETIDEASGDTNKFNLYQRFLEKLGLAPARDATVSFKECAQNPAAASTRQYCFVTLGTSWRSKNWVGEGYAKLLSSLAPRFEIYLIGDRSQQELADQLVQSRSGPDAGVFTLCGKTTLAELVSLIKGAAFGVGPDSGPGHIAAAVGVRYVSVFGPTSPKLVAPVGSEHLVVKAALGCSPCYRRECPGLDRLCMRLISLPKVLEKVRVATATRLD